MQREGEGEEVPCREREERKVLYTCLHKTEQSLQNKATCNLQVLLCLKKALSFSFPFTLWPCHLHY